MQPKFLVLEVQKITNFLELTFFLDLAGCALEPKPVDHRQIPIGPVNPPKCACYTPTISRMQPHPQPHASKKHSDALAPFVADFK
jgi:hypothetical protein